MARPLGVTILGAIVIIAAIVFFLAGLAGFSVALAALLPTVDLPPGETFLWALFYIFVGILLGAAGGGLLRLRPWAWWLAIIASVAALGYYVYLGSTEGWIFSLLTWLALGVAVLIFVYLLAVRRVFAARPVTA